MKKLFYLWKESLIQGMLVTLMFVFIIVSGYISGSWEKRVFTQLAASESHFTVL